MPSTALTKARADLAAARKRASAYRREARSSQGAIMPAATVLAGSAAAGAARVYIAQDIMGLPVEAVAGLLVGGASLATGSAKGLYFATGWLAPYIANTVEDQLQSARQGAAANA